ncbi:unnamed protein product [Cunninghamella blakesleeana]
MAQRMASLSKIFINKPFYTRNMTPIVRQLWRTYTKEVSKLKEQQIITKEQGGKLKELAKKYGPSGILVYLGVGFVDLGITFATIQLVGSDKVKKIEHMALDTFHEAKEKFGFKSNTTTSTDDKVEEDKIIKSTTVNNKKDDDDDESPSLASVFILAYGIHKTLLLPVRLAITTAITPAFVRKIHALGWAKYAPRLFGVSKKP